MKKDSIKKTSQPGPNKPVDISTGDTTINTAPTMEARPKPDGEDNNTRIHQDEIKKFNGQAAVIWGLK